MEAENLRYCAVCGQPLKKYQLKFCSRSCSALFQINQRREKSLEEEKMQRKITDSSFDEVLDPEYSDKDFLGVSTDAENEYAKYGEDILFSFAPNYTSDIPIGTATVYGTPKALADYQFEYFRQKNETTKNADERISLRIYMLTGDICGEPKDIAAFQIAYEKLLEKSTEKTDTEKAEEIAPKDVEQKNEVTEKAEDDDALNNPANFENWTEF